MSHLSIKETERKGIVIVLDKLGTKGSWQRDPVKALNQWEELNDLIDAFFKERLTDKIKYPQFSQMDFQKDAFSDTMIITVVPPQDKLNADTLVNFAAVLASLMTEALENDIRLRGCISVGNFYRSKRMIIGSAIDEAAQYYELPSWIGISLAPSAHLMLSRAIRAGEEVAKNDAHSVLFLQYDIPLKEGYEKNGWALNWPRIYFLQGKYENQRNTLENMLERITDIDIAFKLRNTLDFYDHSRRHFEDQYDRLHLKKPDPAKSS